MANLLTLRLSVMVSLTISLMSFLSCGSQNKVQNNESTQASGYQKASSDDSLVETNKLTYRVSDYSTDRNLSEYQQAIFAGGCFWCTEAAFERIEGVVDVISGYSGGKTPQPKYEDVGAGITGHAEAIYIYYDSAKVSYDKLLDVFFLAAHDPTTLNRQGPDKGEEYRSAIFFKTREEQNLIDSKIKSINATDKLDGKIVTQVEPYDQFWVAEGYHQNFYELNPNQGYVASVSRPKVNKVIKTFPELIKLSYRSR